MATATAAIKTEAPETTNVVSVSEETNRLKGFLGTASEMTAVAEVLSPHSVAWVRSLSDDELFPLGEKALHDIADDILVLDEIRQRFRTKGTMRGYSGWKDFVEKNSIYSVRTIQRRLNEVHGVRPYTPAAPVQSEVPEVRPEVHPEVRPEVPVPVSTPDMREFFKGHQTAPTRQWSRHFMYALGRQYNALKDARVVPCQDGYQILSKGLAIPDFSDDELSGARSLFIGVLAGICNNGIESTIFVTDSDATKVLQSLKELIAEEVDNHADQDLATTTLHCCKKDFATLAALQVHRKVDHGECATGAGFSSLESPLPETFVTAAEVAAAGMWLADFLKASNGVAKADTVRRASQKAGLDWNAVITARDKMTGERGSHWAATWYTEDYAPATFKQEINPAAEAWLRKELNTHTNLEMSSQQAFALGKKNGFSADAIHTAATALGVIQGTPNQWGYPLWTLPVAESVSTDVVTDAVAEAAALCPDVSDILEEPEYKPEPVKSIHIYPQEDYEPSQQTKAAGSRSHGMGLDRLRKLATDLGIECSVSHDGTAFNLTPRGTFKFKDDPSASGESKATAFLESLRTWI